VGVGPVLAIIQLGAREFLVSGNAHTEEYSQVVD
jgi:hypothetical protein